MCCFTGIVREVSGTQIFARFRGERQLLVYSMKMAADASVAMVLPIPVVAGSAENALSFIDLSKAPHFFDDLESCFNPTGAFLIASASGVERLAVQRVGDFEASFVPSRRDFVRLDERFRMPESFWQAMPLYADWGFAVFKLRPDAASRGAQNFHPMAFDFPTRNPGELFFPCVHVHDGEVRPTARFEHAFYAQVSKAPERRRLGAWHSSFRVAGDDLARKTEGLVDAKRLMWRGVLNGEYANEDLWLS